MTSTLCALTGHALMCLAIHVAGRRYVQVKEES